MNAFLGYVQVIIGRVAGLYLWLGYIRVASTGHEIWDISRDVVRHKLMSFMKKSSLLFRFIYAKNNSNISPRYYSNELFILSRTKPAYIMLKNCGRSAFYAGHAFQSSKNNNLGRVKNLAYYHNDRNVKYSLFPSWKAFMCPKIGPIINSDLTLCHILTFWILAQIRVV